MVDWDSATLAELIGAVDISDEPEPVWNRPSTIIGMTIVFAIISGSCVGLRLYTRFMVLKSPGWDDYWIALFMAGGGLGTVCLCMAPSAGLGRHLTTLTDWEFRRVFLLFYIANGAFTVTTNLIKISLLLQYLRVFEQNPPPEGDGSGGTPAPIRPRTNWMRIACLTTLGVVVVWGVIISFMAWFPCFPVRAYWDWDVADAKCYGFGSRYTKPYYYTFLTHSAVNMILDLIILALPMPLFFRSDTLPKTKIGLGGLWLMGAICNLFAVLRLYYTIEHRVTSWPTFDHTWYAPRLDLLGMIEVNFACFCASIPVFWPVVVEKFASLSDIFVTREIKVEVAHRNPRGYLNAESDDGIELHAARSTASRRSGRARTGSGGDGGDGIGMHSRDGSEASLGLKYVKDDNRRSHYRDEYIRDQVDPLRKKTDFVVESEITAGKRD